MTRELEDCQEQQKDLEAQVAEFSKQADVICTKQSVMQAKREDSMKKVCFCEKFFWLSSQKLFLCLLDSRIRFATDGCKELRKLLAKTTG